MLPAHEIASDSSSRLAAGAEKLFRRLFFLIPFGIIGNILFSLAVTDRAAVHAVVHVKAAYLAVALFLSIVPWFTGSYRLYLWGRFLGRDIHYHDTFKMALGAELVAAVTPPFIGGGPAKIGMMMRRGFSSGTAFSLTVLESLEDALFFLVMVPVALTLSSGWDLPLVKKGMELLRSRQALLLVLGAGFALLISIFLLRNRFKIIEARFPRVRTIFEQIICSYRHFTATFRTIFRRGKANFALTMSLTAIQWVCRYSIIALLLMGLGIPARPLLFMALQVVVFALAAFVPSPGGVGGAEALFYLTYRSFLPADAIGLVTASWRFFTFYFLLLMASALLLLFSLASSARTRHAPT
jgi:glycosyltransferase 2 family protein